MEVLEIVFDISFEVRLLFLLRYVEYIYQNFINRLLDHFESDFSEI